MKKLLTILLSMLLLLGAATAMAQINRKHGDIKTEQTKPKQTVKKQNKQAAPAKPKQSSSPKNQRSSSASAAASSSNGKKNRVIQQAVDDMVYVEGGTFMMGATKEQGSDVYSYEKPAHLVILSDFYIGKTEVTQELWLAVMGSNPSYFTGNLQCPVENVTWADCQEFVTKLNRLTGKRFRLPTEAEWEFAARGGNMSQSYKYAGSNTIGNVAWYDYNSGDTTHPVGTKSPNELGLYDMSGNVWEWCQDWYGSYSSEAQTNPTGPETGSIRVCRGGCWGYDAGYCRVSNRDGYTPSYRYYFLGLRLAL